MDFGKQRQPTPTVAYAPPEEYKEAVDQLLIKYASQINVKPDSKGTDHLASTLEHLPEVSPAGEQGSGLRHFCRPLPKDSCKPAYEPGASGKNYY